MSEFPIVILRLPAGWPMRTKFPALIGTGMLLIALVSKLPAQTNNLNIGLPVNGSFSGSDVDSVQLNSGNLHIEIPLYSLGGRGLSEDFKYVYDSHGWSDPGADPINGGVAFITPVGEGGDSPGAPGNNMRWNLAGPLTNVDGSAFPGEGTSTKCSGRPPSCSTTFT